MLNDLFDKLYKPDVLSCLADLSNDEVMTPPDIANKMLDLLPQELFSNPDTKILDPCCKSGVFLREAAKRFIEGEKDQFNSLQECIDWVFQRQLYGIAITELTSLLSRRSVYCSKYPNSPYSITQFDKDNIQGNIIYHRIQHDWEGTGDKRTCRYCGANAAVYERDSALETHAYELIHVNSPEEIFNMKFDVIIGNPPYQLDDGGNGASAMPIYQKFVEQAKKLNPRYLTMIIPARWYAGGKGLDEFRANMLNDNHISYLVDYVNAKDCFPGTSIGGGVCYFLRERDYKGDCKYTNIHDGNESHSCRKLNEYSVFVRYNEAISIIEKVKKVTADSFTKHVGSRNPFGISSSARGGEEKTEYTLFSSAGIGYISKDDITQGASILGKYKVMISKVTAEHAGEPDKSGMFGVLSTTKVLKPNEVCTDSYLIAYSCNTEQEANNCAAYMCTKFFRFLLLQAVTSINLSKDKFQFVPDQDFSCIWNDEMLYKKYNLTEPEIAFIENMIKEKNIGGGND